jgi:hypothetical protein
VKARNTAMMQRLVPIRLACLLVLAGLLVLPEHGWGAAPAPLHPYAVALQRKP